MTHTDGVRAPINPGPPSAEEHIPYYAQYIRLVPEGNVVTILEQQIQDTAAFLTTLTPEQAQRRPAPDEWNVHELVGHLSDSERLLAYRAMKIARADPDPWEPVELDPYVVHGEFNRRALADVVAEFVAVRGATVALLRGLDQQAWTRQMPEAWTVRSVRAFAYAIAGHEIHHIDALRSRV